MEWNEGPFGLDGKARSTIGFEKTLLVAVHHPAAASRLADVVPMLAADPRLQTVYTVPPTSAFARGAERYLDRMDAVVVPWRTAVSQRFDAAIAAGSGALHELHAPVLLLQHGHGPAKLQLAMDGFGPQVRRSIGGAGNLTFGGRVVPAVIGTVNERHRAVIEHTVPEAARVCRLTGDPCWDRLLVSRSHRRRYRQSLGVGDGRALIVVSSTWRRDSLLGQHPDLPERLAAELPAEDFRVVAVPHPATWTHHSHFQMRSWFQHAQRNGLGLLPPEEGWRAALVASDLVIGDHGSVSTYAGALGRPVAMAAFPRHDLLAGSLPEQLGRAVPHLRPGAPLEPQVRQAMAAHDLALGPRFAALLTSVPGEAAERLRKVVYELLGLAEPGAPPRTAPVPLPSLLPPLADETELC